MLSTLTMKSNLTLATETDMCPERILILFDEKKFTRVIVVLILSHPSFSLDKVISVAKPF